MRDSVFWDITVPRVMTIYANVVFVVLWVGFIVALVVNREWLDMLWHWAQALPLLPLVCVSGWQQSLGLVFRFGNYQKE